MLIYKGNSIFQILLFLCIICSIYAFSHRSVHKHERPHPVLKMEYEPLRQVFDDTVYFPVETESINLTCAVTNPSYFYQVQLTKSPKKGTVNTSLIEAIPQYSVSKQFAKVNSARFDIYVSDPEYNSIKVTFIIRNLTLSDNGLYRCGYHTSLKELNVVVYKPFSESDVTFVVNDGTSILKKEHNSLNLTLGTEYTVVCKTNELYPKPTVVYMLNDNKSLSNLVTESAVNVKSNDAFDLYVVTSVLKFTATYKDNENNLACIVANNVPLTEPVSKALRLNVYGIEFIDDECSEEVQVKLNSEDGATISCLFYANPYPNTQWMEPNVVEETEGGSESSSSNDIESAEDNAIQNENEISENNPKYTMTKETIRPGVHRATLKINAPLTAKDLQKFTLIVEGSNQKKAHTFRLQTEDTRSAKVKSSSENGNESNLKATSIHSKILIGLFLNFLVYGLLKL